MIHVEALEQTQKGLRDFLDLPFRLYKKDSNWVPPLYDMQFHSLLGSENPLLAGPHAFFVVYDDDRPVARVLAGVDRRLAERLGEKRGYLGMFECESNMEYARAVLDAAVAYLKNAGMEKIVGPKSPGFIDFSNGLLVDGFDGPPMVFTPYNPPAYGDFFTQYGFVKHRDYYAYWLDLDDFPIQDYKELAIKAQNRFGFRVEHLELRRENLEEKARQITEVIDAAFPADWELSPPTEADILAELKTLLRFATSELMAMAYAEDGKPIGIFLGMPDYNHLLQPVRGRMFPFGWLRMLFGRRSVRAARCCMMFVRPEYQNKAVGIVMTLSAYERARKMGIRVVEASTIDETNVLSILNTERTGAKRYRTYRQYELNV